MRCAGEDLGCMSAFTCSTFLLFDFFLPVSLSQIIESDQEDFTTFSLPPSLRDSLSFWEKYIWKQNKKTYTCIYG